MTQKKSSKAGADAPAPAAGQQNDTPAPDKTNPASEVGGREGPDPTRYGDWEKNGRCIDF